MLIENVLVIDDDEVSNMLLSCQMEDACKNCSLTFKKNGEEALSYLKLQSIESDPFDLIILDFNLPDMNACDFMKAYEENFAAIFPATQIIILTCHARQEDRQLLLQYCSVAAFFNKPLQEDQLIQIMKERLNHP